MSDLCDICEAELTKTVRDCKLCKKGRAHSLCILEHCRGYNVKRWMDSWRCQACAGESSSSEVLSKPTDLETLGQRVEQLGTSIEELRGTISEHEQEISTIIEEIGFLVEPAREEASAGTFGGKKNIEEIKLLVKEAVKEEVDKIREASLLSDPELLKKHEVTSTGTGGSKRRNVGNIKFA